MDKEARDIRDLLSPWLDGELDPDARAAVEAALEKDAALRGELDAMRQLDRFCRDLDPVTAPPELEAGIRRRLDARVVAFPRRLPARRVWPLAAAAVLVVALSMPLLYRLSAPHRMQTKMMAPAADETADTVQLARGELAEENAPSPEAVSAGIRADGGGRREPAPAEEATVFSVEEDESAPPAKARGQQAGASAAGLSIQNRDLEKAAPAGEQRPGYAAREKTPPQPIAEAAPEIPETVAGAAPLPLPAPPEKLDAEPPETMKKAETAAPETLRQSAGNRIFVLRENIWIQEGYAGEKTQPLPRDASFLATLVELHPEIGEIAALGPEVILLHGDTWYHLLPAEKG
jgi:hypothetical protein